MIRAAMAHAGGVRIDHAFGLARLWVVPDGGGAKDGAYLTYPFVDLLRLLALESHRARAFVVAEDLGTAPWGFHEAIMDREMPGMRVLWFERAWDAAFRPAKDYDPRCLAMTGTHDTPTVAGWWRGTDIDWSDRLGRYKTPDDRAAAEQHRVHERAQLWTAAGHGTPQPEPDTPERAVTAAAALIADAASPLAVFPLEDVLAIAEQPNIPGTVAEHPNWRRRLAAPLATLLDAPQNAARIDAIARARAID
jgi:4-alpha-glucanotransferase